MDARQIEKFGVPKGEPVKAAMGAAKSAMEAGFSMKKIRRRIKRVVKRPDAYLEDEHFADLARLLFDPKKVEVKTHSYEPPAGGAPWKQWGEDHEEGAVQQMRNAASLPISVKGALMADAHQGYGLPIGGVLATRGAVIPYAVGVDIACRMRMSVLDLPLDELENNMDRFKKAIREETRFGVSVARRGWLEKKNVLNTLGPEKLLKKIKK